MECLKCKSPNPDGKKFCGDCGTSLDPTAGDIDAYLESNLGPRVQALIKEQYKDQKLVEIDVTEAVVTKLSGWAKLLGFFVGIPLTLLALVLGFLGIKTYSDFSGLVNSGKQEISQTFQIERQKAQQQADVFTQQAGVFKADSDQLAQKSEELKSKYKQLENQLTGVDALAQNVKALTVKVERIEEKIGFEPSAALTPGIRSSLEDSFASFSSYLANLGFRPKKGRVRVAIDPKYDQNAMYISAENRIIIGPSMSRERQAVYYIYAVHALGGSGVTGSSQASSALQSGLADYLACSFSNNPLLGEEYAKAVGGKVPGSGKPYLRNLKNNRMFSKSKEIEIHDEGEVWGGAFWELRDQIGQRAADRLLFSTWSALRPQELSDNNVAISFVKKLLDIDSSSEGGKHANQIRSVFERRGLRI